MNKIFKIVITLLFSTVALAQGTKTINLGDVSEVEVFDRINVVLIPSNEYKAEVSGSNVNDVEFELIDKKLKIHFPLHKFLEGESTKVLFYYKELHRVEGNEGSNISNTDVLKGRELLLEAKEGAEVRLNIEAETVKTNVFSAGVVAVAGVAAVQVISVLSGGKFEGKDLITKETSVSVTAIGKAKIFATETVNAKVRLSGTIEVYGNPKQLTESRSMGGTIVRK
ncbi:DUF2807 domain-containing protein [Flavobacterium sp.]|uniref:GIN domain-containing protein n=1 Tax=Flavobacterium sp. TaxID=239 RepID=UPI002624CBB0|nr:DUF2807 domain-containing protein [Flavobacterium sp.]